MKKKMQIYGFLEELEKTKHWKWRFVGCHHIRCMVDGKDCCPVTATHSDHESATLVVPDTRPATMSYLLMNNVVDASDRITFISSERQMQHLRKRILKAVGLRE